MASASAVPGPLRMNRFSDVGMAVAILTIVALLIVPLPEPILDLLIVANLTGAVVILLVALTTTEPLEFSVFPSVLLVSTLFRLALNISATKLILATGHAGSVIDAFGNVVVGGNFVVGVIAFAILVVVQFVVITNGAGRVAEVAARFTLDALPGKQMSIDADLQAGLINETEARERRQKIEREADFYGSMDGASKFVRGDAIAAVLIILINIVGGFVIGMLNGQADALTILRTYTLLTVGEGLVSQVPALIISTATGLMVTRAAGKSHMGQEFAAQLLANPRPLLLAGALLFALVPIAGFPKIPLLLIGSLAAAGGFLLLRGERDQAKQQAVVRERESKSAARPQEDPTRLLAVDVLRIELGSNLLALALPDHGGDLADRVGQARKSIALELGIVLPTVRLRDNLSLPPNEYVIKLRDQVVARWEVQPNMLLAIDSGSVSQRMDGIATTEPAFGGSAVWIARSEREAAEIRGYIVAQPSSVIITHLTEIIRKHAAELLTRQELQSLIEGIKAQNKAVVDELIPQHMTLGEVQKVLQALLRERVSVRDLGTILEALADWAPRTKDLDQLVEYTRSALARQICKQHTGEGNTLHVILLEGSLDQQLRDHVQPSPVGSILALEPSIGRTLVDAIGSEAERCTQQGYSPVLLCSTQIRLPLQRLLGHFHPTLPVLSYNEIVQGVDLVQVGVVRNTMLNQVGIAA